MNLRPVRYLLISLLFILVAQAWAAIPQTERDALLALYTATGGDHWHDNTYWNSAAGTECAWHGVSCNTDQSSVTGLHLKANNLKGPLPGELINLTRLSSTDLRYNGVYSDNQGLIDFLDASGPVGALPDTQTLDANHVKISAVGETGVDLNWWQVSYQQTGGYRVYVSEQLESDGLLLADMPSKQTSSVSLSGLTACAQYHARVHSYTLAHEDNPHDILSDGQGGKPVSFVPNWNVGCIPDLTGENVYIELYEDTIKGTTTVTVKVDQHEPLIYLMSTTGNVLRVPNIHAGNSVILLSNTSMVINGLTIENDNTDHNSAVLISGGSDFAVSDVNSFEINQNVSADLISNSNVELEGSSLDYGEGYIAITRGVGTHDLAEDTPVDSSITTVNVKFPVREAFADQMTYRFSSGNEDGMFSIDSKSGEIVLLRPLDFEETAQYRLAISAGDGEANYTGMLTLNITDVQEDDAAGGCSLRPGAPFDPVWLLMSVLAAFYGFRRSQQKFLISVHYD